MKKQTLMILIIVIVALGIVGGGLYYYQTQKNEVTTNLKTYSNKTIGLEFQYPVSWPNLAPDTGGKPDLISDQGDTMQDGKVFSGFNMPLIDLSNIMHWNIPQDENIPMDEQFDRIKCGSKYTSGSTQCENKVSTNGVKYVWMIQDTKGGPSYTALVATGKYMLTFLFADMNNYNARASEYQALLASMKAVGGNSAEQTDLKTYQNQKLGFQFQYPLTYVLDKTYESKGIIQLYDTATYADIKNGKIVEGASSIGFSVYNNPKNLSAIDWAKDADNSGYSNFNDNFNPTGEYKNIQVDGVDAISYSWVGMGGGDTIVVKSKDSKSIYLFDVGYANKSDKIVGDFLQIVETIKF